MGYNRFAELNEEKKMFTMYAELLGDYQNISKADLANGYCDAEESGDESLRSAYWAAIMLRYWFRIYEWIENSASLYLEPEDFVHWLGECINDALYYRSWRPMRHPTRKEIKAGETRDYIPNPQYLPDDPNAFDKSMNNFCLCKRAKEYQHANKLCRKGQHETYSLDQMQEATGDAATSYAGAYEEPLDQSSNNDLVTSVVGYFLDRHNYIEAIIVDGIANGDAYKEVKGKRMAKFVDDEGNEYEEEVPSYKSEFNERMLVKHLNQIDEDYMKTFFVREYGMKESEALLALAELKKLNNTKLYKMIEATQIKMRTNKDILALVS